MFRTLIVGFACYIPISVMATPYKSLIEKHSLANGLDPHLVTAVMARESAFKPNARSPKDARGLMQVIPSTAKLMGVDPNRLFEPEQSIIAGTRYLAFLKRRFNGDLTKVIAGYNAGHGAVEKYGGIPPFRETQNYVRLVSSKYLTLGGKNNFNTPQIAKRTDNETRKNNIIVLADWQKRQIQDYSNNEYQDSSSYDYSPTEAVKVRVNSQSNTISSNNQNVQQASFVQTLNQGQYVQVF